ncbi:MASE1 domain-containing protein [Kitasatospora atroaurantiaca]|uniref:Integral membrane sensor domain MASE1 n=1 Tax=Kitasatospora atroaurantiaca TaxID=285545 RepID=A0A561ES74_9ACTN|nr:MASE1 domain-containing protein [Kitasatospora atroaurantiaca]TWE18468.1 integral membrane sensor domain MASE1 [Kitasatospora atroaurantiaca]
MAAVVRNEEIRRLTATGLQILAVAAVYFAAGRLGLLQQVVVAGAKVTPLWPPTGIALTCLLLLGVGIWPGITLGAFLVIATIGSFNPATVGIVVGNTLAPVCALLMLRRVGFRVELDRLRDGVALVFLGAFAGMLISATMGAGSLVLEGSLPTSAFWHTWAAWWTGDAMGVLVITPLLLVIREARLPRGIGLYQWAEPAALLAGTAVVTLVVSRTSLDLLFLVFPLLIWAALRFQLAGAAPCVLLVSVITISAATDHVGPFAEHGLLAIMVTLQGLNGAAALTALLLAAIITERKSTYRRIQQACTELAEVVARLAPGEAGHRWPPAEDGDRRTGG